MSENLTDASPMPFGKHQGKKMEDVPASYLLWLWNENVTQPAVRAYIQDNLDVLKFEHPDTLVRP